MAEKQPVGVLFLQRLQVHLGKVGAEVLPGGEDHLGSQAFQVRQTVIPGHVKVVNHQEGIPAAQLPEPQELPPVIRRPGPSILGGQAGKLRVVQYRHVQEQPLQAGGLHRVLRLGLPRVVEHPHHGFPGLRLVPGILGRQLALSNAPHAGQEHQIRGPELLRQLLLPGFPPQEVFSRQNIPPGGRLQPGGRLGRRSAWVRPFRRFWLPFTLRQHGQDGANAAVVPLGVPDGANFQPQQLSFSFLLPFRQLRPLYNGIVMDSSVFS